jgi:uncharacterized membrane protein YdfJ with MMPL/SSD domain
MQTYITSSFLHLKSNDYAKGLVVAVISAVLNFLYPLLTAHALPNLTDTAYVAAIAGVGYLIKNFFTPSSMVTPVEPAV